MKKAINKYLLIMSLGFSWGTASAGIGDPGHVPYLIYHANHAQTLKNKASDNTVGTLGISTKALADFVLNDIKSDTAQFQSIVDQVTLSEDKEELSRALLDIVLRAGYLRYVVDNGVESDDTYAYRMLAMSLFETAAPWNSWQIDPNIALNPADSQIATRMTKASIFFLDWFGDTLTAPGGTVNISSLQSQLCENGVTFLMSDNTYHFDDTGLEKAAPNFKIAAATALGYVSFAFADEGITSCSGITTSLINNKALTKVNEALTDAGGWDGAPAEGRNYGNFFMSEMTHFDLEMQHRGISGGLATSYIENYPYYYKHTLGTRFDSPLINFNDTHLDGQGIYLLPLMMSAANSPTSEAARVAQQVTRAFIDYYVPIGTTPDLPPAVMHYVDNSIIPSTDEALTKVFTSSGDVFTRSDWNGFTGLNSDQSVLFAYKSTQSMGNSTTHRHYDAGHINLYIGKDMLLADPGYANSAEGILSRESYVCSPTTPEQGQVMHIRGEHSYGHNTITLENLNYDASDLENRYIMQTTFADFTLKHTKTNYPYIYTESEFGDSYSKKTAAGEVVTSARRKVIGMLPDFLLVYDRIELNPTNTDDIRARFHLNASGWSNAINQPNQLSEIEMVQGNAVMKPLYDDQTTVADYQLQIATYDQKGNIIEAPKAPLPVECNNAGESMVVAYSKAAENHVIELYTALFPEEVANPGATIPSIKKVDESGMTYTKVELSANGKIYEVSLRKSTTSNQALGNIRVLDETNMNLLDEHKFK